MRRAEPTITASTDMYTLNTYVAQYKASADKPRSYSLAYAGQTRTSDRLSNQYLRRNLSSGITIVPIVLRSYKKNRYAAGQFFPAV